MKNQNTIITIIAIIAIVLGTLKVSSWYYGKKLDEANTAIRNEKIKNSELEMIKEGLYIKLAADTLTIKELKRINDSLGLELKDPKIVTVIKFVPKYIEKPIDSLDVTDSLITIVDYYPSKIKPFITYTGKVDRFSETGIGSFKFTPLEFRLGIGQNKDGTYSITSKVPEFFEVTGLDVQALPLTPVKVDSFGWIIGARLGEDLTSLNKYIKLNGGIRYKKVYLSVGAATNKTVEGGLDIEF